MRSTGKTLAVITMAVLTLAPVLTRAEDAPVAVSPQGKMKRGRPDEAHRVKGHLLSKGEVAPAPERPKDSPEAMRKRRARPKDPTVVRAVPAGTSQGSKP
jgi:hypothetical protein